MTRALSGLFSSPERRLEAAQDAAIENVPEAEDEDEDEEERLFNQQEVMVPQSPKLPAFIYLSVSSMASQHGSLCACVCMTACRN